MSFGKKLQALRTKRGTTQKKLADAIHTTDAYISALETDRKLPSYVVTTEIARVLGTDAQELLSLVEQTKIAKAVDKEQSRRTAFVRGHSAMSGRFPAHLSELMTRLEQDPAFHRAVCNLSAAMDGERKDLVLQLLAEFAKGD